MAITKNIQWPRIFAEGVAIVVSILLAFGIQAWWEGRQDREDETVILSNLLDEFRQIRANINDIQDYQVAILASAYRLAELAEHSDADISDQELDGLLSDQTWVSSPANFSAPVLNAIIERGDDRLISSSHLRALLILLPGKFNWIRENLQEDVDFMHSHLEPYLYENGSLLHLSQADLTRPGTSGFVFPAPPVEPRTTFSHRPLLEAREFQNLMLQRAVILEDIISLARYPDLPAKIDETIAAIESELARLRP